MTGGVGAAADVVVRYWAAVREAAGTREERVRASSLAGVLAEVTARHVGEARFARRIGTCTFVVDGVPAGTAASGRDWAAVQLRDGSVIDVLPPFAGGAAG